MANRVLLVLALAGLFVEPASAQSPSVTPSGPCAPPAVADPMPEGGSHDHADPAQHKFSCALDAVASLDLKDLIPEPMMFGEIDVAGHLAVMATTFPEAGFVVFDVADPANPRVLGRYRGPRCETETDTDCGADVKLSPDGKLAFLAVQRAGRAARPESKRITPGIVVVSLADPSKPSQTFFLPLPPIGVHMLAYHEVAGSPYVFARIRTSQGKPAVLVARVSGATLSKVIEIPTDGAHDVFPFDDPSDGKTYLDVSGAQSGSVFFFDVTDVSKPREVGRWTPPVEISGNVWYIHNAWTFREGSKRFTFVGAELYSHAGSLPPGHGGVPGPLWLLDTTDFTNPKLIGEWRNPGNHKAGDLTFSPHQTWYAGNGITWTSHYHGGVWVLDWADVLDGKARRPREIGYNVPSSINRPFVVSDAKDKFITAPPFLVRPLMWDVVAQGDYAFASDINGGFIVLHRPDRSPASKPASESGGSSPIGLIVLAIVVFASLPLLVLARKR